ncbi:MAG: ABC transporter substrate-binding protein [Armatimonadota bacterium]
MDGRLAAHASLAAALVLASAPGACWGQVVEDKPIVRVVLCGYGFPGEMELYQDALASFNRKHPQAEARLSVQGWPDAYASIRNWLTQTDEAAYVVLVRDEWLPELATGLVPLEDLLSQEEFDQYYGSALDRCRHGGQTYGLPWVARTKALYYRSDLLRQAGVKPPRTWDELITVAGRIASPPDIYGFGLPAADQEESAELFLLLLWAQGGTLVRPEGKWELGPAALSTLEFYSELSNVRHVTQPETTTYSYGDLLGMFAVGRLGMVVADQGLAGLLDGNPVLRNLHYGIAPLPGGEQAITQVSADMLAISAGSRREDLALELLRHLMRDGLLAALGEAAGLPAKRSVAERATSPKLRPFLAGIKAARGKPLAIWPEARGPILQLTYEVLTGRKLPEAALRDMALHGVPVLLPPAPEEGGLR